VKAGGLIHLELHTGDCGAAVGFLSQLVGWQSERVVAAAGSYLTLSMGDRIGGGIVECGARPAQWVPYAVVDSLERATADAETLGAAVLLGPRQTPSGRRSVVSSPAGGTIALWEPRKQCAR
jgi:uncharacterized protein